MVLGRRFICSLCIGFIVATSTVSFADTHYVSLIGSHTTPFTAWASAATNLQAAVDAAAAGDTILLSSGTYALSKEIVVSNAVVISGVSGAEQTIIDGNNSNRCFNCTDAGVLIKDLTITKGQGDGGAGIFCAGGTIQDCVVIANNASGWSGGGVSSRGDLVIRGTTISGNTADYGGGVAAQASLVLDSSTVSGNNARVDGGGVCAGKGVCSISNTVVTGNAAGRSAAGIDTICKTVLSVTSSTISSNTAGCAISSYGGGLRVARLSSALLRGTAITANSSGFRGGGIFNSETVTLDACTISSNSAGNAGGGVYNYKGRNVKSLGTTLFGNESPAGPDFHGTLESYCSTVENTNDCTIIEMN